MKKFLITFLLIIALTFTVAAATYVPKDLTIHYDNATKMYVGEQVTLKTNSLYTYKSTNDEVATYDANTNTLEAVGTGYVVVCKVNIETSETVKTYTYIVSDAPTKVSVIGTNSLAKGENARFTASVYPACANQSVIWSSSDTSVLTIDEDGVALAKGNGLVTVTATSTVDKKIFGKIYVMINDPSPATVVEVNKNIDVSNLAEVFEAVTRKVEDSVVMVTGYTVTDGVKKEGEVGCGIIYKRVAYLSDGTTSEDPDIDLTDVVKFEYYVVTNKHVVSKTTYSERTAKSTTKNYDYIGIYYGDTKELSANIIAYDTKVDIAVITFTSTVYFPIAILGSSEDIKSGEFIVSVGTAEGKAYFRTITFGIISYPKRYISDDTDGDETNDWDAEYIQHDAPINSADCGSPIINMKGEVIGMNTTKKIESSSGTKVENLSFAIPIDLVKSLVSRLEKGEVPQRPLLGVSVMDVKDMLSDKDYYAKMGYIVPEGIEHGFYVAEVTAGGVGAIAGVEVGDILISFNGVDLYYSYQLRAQLGTMIIGSGMKATIVVYRGTEYLTLEGTF